MLFGCVIDVAVFIIFVRGEEVDGSLLESTQKTVFVVYFAKLVRVYEGLNIPLSCKIFSILASKVAPEVHIAKKNLIILFA